ncbi:MAG: DUF2309 domain-containing protein [Polyangiaceae bacterium]
MPHTEPPSSRIRAALSHAAHLLPAQAPLEVFVHHNTLHAFQRADFHEALEQARAHLGAEGYWSEDRYREAHARGRIQGPDLTAAIERLWLPDLGDMPPGLPSTATLATLALTHGVAPESPAGLRWRLTELQAGERFHDGVAPAARDRIARETTAWLRAQAREGGDERIVVAELWQACQAVARRAPVVREASPAPARPASLRDQVLLVSAEDPDELVNPVLVNLAGAFLDRGQSRWSMPDRDAGFFAASCRVLGAGRAVRPVWLRGLGDKVRRWTAEGKRAEAVVEEALSELCEREEDHAHHIESALLRLPGWAGMFHKLETAPGPAGRSHARVRLMDFLAVRLMLDVLAVTDVAQRLGHRGPLRDLPSHLARLRPLAPPSAPGDHDRAWPLFLLAQHAGLAAPEILRLGPRETAALLTVCGSAGRRVRLRVWQEAFEQHYRDEVLGALSAARAACAMKPTPRPGPEPRFQVVACIDDRMESLRRHIEELSPDHETFGAAGFFNLAIAYQGIDDPSTFPLCPVVVSPRHRIEEVPVSEHAGRAEARRRWKRRMGSVASRFDSASRSMVWGPLVVALTGIFAALPLLAAVFAPWWAARLRRAVSAWLLPPPKTRLNAPPPSPDSPSDPDAEPEPGSEGEELAAGFTVEEKAQRVGDLLRNMGLTGGFARLVVLLGHDSHSVNNPHVAAYSCGACGGRSGGPNARLFARMANRPEVRARLRERGVDIPDTTVFIGGAHDTCTDTIALFDTDALPTGVLPEVKALQAMLDNAALADAHERCRRFASAPRSGSPAVFRRHVEQRAFDLSQARPELGHATNAACIVGRRERTRGVFLDRRAFLVSYDPSIDPEGEALEKLLAAAVPVGAGINLEYYFSTVDNERLGAGTKLPHNVVGLFGVMNGAASDLRTGLPRQMIEVHEPMRLQVVIEARPEILAAVVARQPVLKELVDGAWVRVCSMDPETGSLAVLEPREGFVPWAGRAPELPRVGCSRDWYSGKEGFVPPALVGFAQEMRDVA